MRAMVGGGSTPGWAGSEPPATQAKDTAANAAKRRAFMASPLSGMMFRVRKALGGDGTPRVPLEYPGGKLRLHGHPASREELGEWAR